MVFSSLTFLSVALPIILGAYYICPKPARNACLLIFSLVFYAWGEPIYILIMLFSIATNYLIAQNLRGNRTLLIAALCINLGMLGVFKYSGMLVQSLNALFSFDMQVSRLALPIGISFYTFQSLSYVIDVYRGRVPAQRSPLKLALYICLFPQLIAGPIVRYADVIAQIDARIETFEGFTRGVQRFSVGLAKKVLIANTLAVVADQAFAQGDGLSAGAAWIGVLCYAFQIYYDFSGYSDMAIGLGGMFGFHFFENFNHPYIATSIRAFWNRWHISLSGWFRDYVYIPLGGSRRHALRNIAIVFLLTGLWHGANWTFVFWGAYHGVFRMIEEVSPLKPRGVFGWIYTMTVVLVGWVFFRAENFAEAWAYLNAMIHFYGGAWLTTLTPKAALVFGVAIVGVTPIARRLPAHLYALRWPAAIALTALSILALASAAYNPFIYFRF